MAGNRRIAKSSCPRQRLPFQICHGVCYGASKDPVHFFGFFHTFSGIHVIEEKNKSFNDFPNTHVRDCGPFYDIFTNEQGLGHASFPSLTNDLGIEWYVPMALM